MYNPGIRVGAISHTDKDAVYLFGYGVYEGDFPRVGPGVGGLDADAERKEIEEWAKEERPEMTEEQIKEFALLATSNPRIKLDSGKTVWGCQCWWGPEEQIKQAVGNRKVVMIDIDEQIDKHKQKEN